MSSQCICNVTNPTITVKCGICSSSFDRVLENTDTRYFHCKIHAPIMICGPLGETCNDCKNVGLMYVAGYGGPPYILNVNTNEKTYTK